MRMLFQQFRGGSGFNNLVQPQQRRMDSPPAPYGISMSSPFLRGSSDFRPMPRIRDVSGSVSNTSGSVGSTPIGTSNVRPMPRIVDDSRFPVGRLGQGNVYESPFNQPSAPRAAISNEQAMRLREQDERQRRMVGGAGSGDVWGNF